MRDVPIVHDGKSATIDLLLPPSYDEQPKKRYPVLGDRSMLRALAKVGFDVGGAASWASRVTLPLVDLAHVAE